MNRFFVYGTLMRGMSNFKHINPDFIEKIEPATIDNMNLYLIQGGAYPCMLDGSNTVYGEIITIKKKQVKKILMKLDAIEGYSGPQTYRRNLYNREIKKVRLDNGKEVAAYVYMFNPFYWKYLGPEIERGDFKYYKKVPY